MDKQAVEQIQESANIPQLIEQLAKTDSPAAIVPGSMKIESLERFMANPNRYRLNFATDNIADFCRYNKAFDREGAICFIDAEQMTAKTIFDLGTEQEPEHKENTARIRLKMTALFRAITEISGIVLSQKTASEFIEDWGEELNAKNSENKAMTWPLAAKALRDLTIAAAKEISSKVGDFGESMSAMERIEAKNQSEIPASLTFDCEPYPHLSKRKFIMRVSILTGGDKPNITFRLIQIERAQEEMAKDFKEILTNDFKDCELQTFIGSV